MPIETPVVPPVAAPPTDRKSKLEEVLKGKPLPPEQQKQLRDLFSGDATDNTKIRGALDPLTLDNDSKNQIWKAYYSLDHPVPPAPKIQAPVVPKPPVPPVMLQENQPYMKHLAPAPLPPPPSPSNFAPKSYDTALTPAEEQQFTAWKAQYAPKDSGEDYDLRGAFKAGLTPDPTTGHWPDTFKKPNHPTFSNESKYAAMAPDKAGHWDGDTFVPPSVPNAPQPAPPATVATHPPAKMLQEKQPYMQHTTPAPLPPPPVPFATQFPGIPPSRPQGPLPIPQVGIGDVIKGLPTALATILDENQKKTTWEAFRDTMGTTVKGAGGLLQAAAGGYYEPEKGTLTLPRRLLNELVFQPKFVKTDKGYERAPTPSDPSVQIHRPLSEVLQQDWGLPADLAQNGNMAAIGKFVGVIEPWSKLSGGVSGVLRGAEELSEATAIAKIGAEGGVDAGNAKTAYDVTKEILKHAGIQAATGEIYAHLEKAPEGETPAQMESRAAQTAMYGAAFSVLFDGVAHILQSLPKGKPGTLTADTQQKIDDVMKDVYDAFYRSGSFSSEDMARRAADRAFTSGLERGGTPAEVLDSIKRRFEANEAARTSAATPAPEAGPAVPEVPKPTEAPATTEAAVTAPPKTEANAHGFIADQTTPGMPSIPMTAPPEGKAEAKPEIPSVPTPKADAPIPPPTAEIEKPETPPKSVVPEEVGIPAPKKQFTHDGQFVVGTSEGKIVLADGSLVDRAPSYLETLKKFGYKELKPEQIATLSGLAAANAAPAKEVEQPKIPSLRKGDVGYVPKFSEEELAAEAGKKPAIDRRAPEGPFSALPRVPEDPAYFDAANKAVEDRLIDKLPAVPGGSPEAPKSNLQVQQVKGTNRFGVFDSKKSDFVRIGETKSGKVRTFKSQAEAQKWADGVQAGVDRVRDYIKSKGEERGGLPAVPEPESAVKPKGTQELISGEDAHPELSKRWTMHTGLDQEAEAFLDGENEEDAKAAIIGSNGTAPDSTYTVETRDGRTLGPFDTMQMAADAAEQAFPQRGVGPKVPKAIEGPKTKAELPAAPEPEVKGRYSVRALPDGTFGIVNPKGNLTPGPTYGSQQSADLTAKGLQDAFDKAVGKITATPKTAPAAAPAPKTVPKPPAIDVTEVARKALQTPPSADRLEALKKKMAAGPKSAPPSPLISEMSAQSGTGEHSDAILTTPAIMGRYVDNAPTTTTGHPILYADWNIPEQFIQQLSKNEELGNFSKLVSHHFDVMAAILKSHGQLPGMRMPQFGISLAQRHLGGHINAKDLGRKPGHNLIIVQPYRILGEIEVMLMDGKVSRADTALRMASRIALVLPHEFAHSLYADHSAQHTGEFGRNADILFDELRDARDEIRTFLEADDYAAYNNFLNTYRELVGFWQGGLSGHAGAVSAGGAGTAGSEIDTGAGAGEGTGSQGTVPGRTGWETTDMAAGPEPGAGHANFTDLDEAAQSDLIELGSYQYQTSPDWKSWSEAMGAVGDWVQPYLATAFDFIDNVAAFSGVAEPQVPEPKAEAKGELPHVPKIGPAPGESGAVHAGGNAGVDGEAAAEGAVEQGTGQPGAGGGGNTPAVPGRKPRPRGNGGTGQRGTDAITRGGIDNSGFYRITEADKLGEGGAVAKFKRNIAAIKVLKALQEDKRLPTEEERKTLASYVGWGSLSQQAFDRHGETGALARELEGLISYEEFAAARKSTVNAHYTSPETVKFMWDLATRLGFKGNGTILEPAMGTGNFLGMAPDSAIQRGNFIGTELDHLTGNIAKYLYPGADIRVTGYENLAIPDNTVDVAISNVPFGEKVYDPAYPKLNARIHDYFFIKTLDKIRPGGILMFVTSKGTMDKANDRVRELMADKADLVAAYRLPNTAFAKNAATEVTTDIIILQKREPTALRGGESFLESKEISEGLSINEYYIKHPENMFGKMTLGGTMYRGGESTLEPTLPLPQMMAKAMESAPKNVFKGKIRASGGTTPSIVDQLAPTNIKDLAYTLNEKGQLVQNIGGMLKAPQDPAVSAKGRLPQMKDLIGLREQLKKLISAQMMSSDDAPVKVERDMLNTMYDDYVKQYGILHDRKTDIFSEDPQYTLLLALEDYDVESKAATKAAIFTKRTIQAITPLEVVSTDIKEALLQVLGERGFPDIPFLAQLSGKTEAEAAAALESQDLVFQNPASGNFEMADIYLSGRTRDKLDQAMDAATRDPKFNRNVEALKKAQPEDTAIENIFPVLGQPWIPEDAARDFIMQVINDQQYGRARDIKVRLIADGTWDIAFRSPGDADLKWGSWSAGGGGGKTMDFSAEDLVKKAMNMRRPVVQRIDSDGNKYTDKEATLNAREKINEIQEAFQTWARSNATWSPKIAEIFNKKFNAIKLLKYDGSHLSFPGMNAEKQLNPHQKDVVWRTIVDGRVLMAHAVGTGKTYGMIAAGMELRRLGISKKNMYAVPNRKVSQWVDEFMTLYPGASVLAVGRDDLAGDRRRETISRIATGDWDAVILQHSSFGLIPISPERMKKTLDREMESLEETLMQARLANPGKGNKKDPSVKALEKAKDKLEARLKKLADMPHDNTIYFDHLGIDYLFVDEIHEFKNLNYYTKMGNISGLSQSDAKKGLDLKTKAEYIQDKNRGRGVIGATGTPISNSMAEMYNMTRYVAPDVLESAGVSPFDSWASTFGEIRTVFELSADGRSYRPRPKFSHFINVQGLLQMFRSFADVKHSWELKLKIPTIKGGGPQPVEVKSNEVMEPVFEGLLQRAERLRTNPSASKQKGADNWLSLTSDGKKVALDLRLFDANLPDHPLSKSNIAVEGIYDRWKASEDKTQIVFADLYQDKTQKFNLYEDMKHKLMARGVPEKEIAIAHDYETDDELLKMQQQMNNGQVRILFGSTAKIGVGLNVQRLLKAQHNLDAPWRPDQVEQRQGRTVRQKNKNEEVEILNYVTEHSFDAYIFQALETKAQFIGTAMSGDFKGFEMDDAAGAVVMNFAAMKALASGNPDVQLKVKLEQEISILTTKKRNHDSDENVKKASIRQRQDMIRNIHAQAAHLEKAKNEYDQYMADHPVPEAKVKLTPEQEALIPKYTVRQNGISKLFQVVDPEGNPVQKLNKLGDMVDVFYDTEKEALSAAKHEQKLAAGDEDAMAEGQLFDAVIGGVDFKSKDELISYITENKDKVMQTGAMATLYGVPVKFEAVFAKGSDYKVGSDPLGKGFVVYNSATGSGSILDKSGKVIVFSTKDEAHSQAESLNNSEDKINHRYSLANQWEDVPETVPGFLQSVKFRLGRLGGIIQTRNENVAEQQRVIDSVEKELGKPFRYQADLDKAENELKEVDARLTPPADKKPGDEAIEDDDVEDEDVVVKPRSVPAGKQGDIPPPVAGPPGRGLRYPAVNKPPQALLKPPLTVGDATYDPVIIKRTTQDGRPMEPLSGWEIAPGIAVAPTPENPDRFQITHMRSGAKITDAFSAERAAGFAKKISTLGDWTRTIEEFMSDKPFRETLQSAIKMSDLQRGSFRLFGDKPPQKIPESVVRTPQQNVQMVFNSPQTVSNAWESIKALPGMVKRTMVDPFIYNKDIEMWPVFAEMVRRFQENPADAAFQAAAKIEQILHGMDNSEFQVFSKIVYLEDLYETAVMLGEDSVPVLPDPATGRSVIQDIEAEMDRLRNFVATPEVLASVDRHHVWMQDVWDDLVRRGKVEENSGRVKYYPNFIRRFGEGMDNVLGLPYRMKDPKRMYLKQRKGHQQIHDSNYVRVMEQYATRVFIDNSIDDFIQKVAEMYDLRTGTSTEFPRMTAASLKAMLAKGMKPGQIFELPDGKQASVYQFSPGRVMYPAKVINDYVIQDAINAGIDELGIDIGKLRQAFQNGQSGLQAPPELETMSGEELTRHGIIMGGQHKMYLLPREISNKLMRFRESSSPNPITELARVATKAFKVMALHSNVLSWQGQNVFSNNIMAAVEDINILGRQKQALQLLRGKLTGPQYDVLLNLIHDARVWNSTFLGTGGTIGHAINRPGLRPYRAGVTQGASKLNPFGDNPVGDFLRAYESKLRMLEAITKVASFLENYDRVMQGLPVKHVSVNLGGLDPTSVMAVGRVARELNGDYGATNKVARPIQTLLFPFATWYVRIVPQVVRALRHKIDPKADVGLLLMAGLFIAAYTWNHLHHWETEKKLDWQKETLHIDTGIFDESGKPFIWSEQTPFDAALQIGGLHTFSSNLDRAMSGEWTLEQAAKKQLSDMFGFQDQAWLPTAPGAMAQQLLNPMIGVFTEMSANRDSLTGAEIVKKSNPNQWGTLSKRMPDNPAGVRLMEEYFGKRLIAPYMQAMRAEQINDPDGPLWNWVTEGPLSWKKLLGIRTANLDALDMSKWYDDKNWEQSLLETHSKEIIDTYVQYEAGNLTPDELEDRVVTIMQKDGPSITVGPNIKAPTAGYDVYRMMQTTSFKLQVDKALLGKAADPEKRKAIIEDMKILEDKLRMDSYKGTPKSMKQNGPNGLPYIPEPPVPNQIPRSIPPVPIPDAVPAQ